MTGNTARAKVRGLGLYTGPTAAPRHASFLDSYRGRTARIRVRRGG